MYGGPAKLTAKVGDGRDQRCTKPYGLGITNERGHP